MPPTEGFPWDNLRKNFALRSKDGQGTKWGRNIAEISTPLSTTHERYRQTTDGFTRVTKSRSGKNEVCKSTFNKFKNLNANRTQRRFLFPWPWAWLDDLHILTGTRYSKMYLHTKNEAFVKAFRSGQTHRQTDRQTDRCDRLHYYTRSRVVISINQLVIFRTLPINTFVVNERRF